MNPDHLPPCPICGRALAETTTTDAGETWRHYRCAYCGWEVDDSPRLTVATAPWTAPVWREVEALRELLDNACEAMNGGETGPEQLPELISWLGAARYRDTERIKELRAKLAAQNDPFDLVRAEHPHVTQTSIGLVRHLITCAFYGSRRGPRWSHVGTMFGHGSGVSQALCRACGVDPYEMLGEADWGYESSVTIALVDLPDPRDAEIAALRARLEHRDAWLTLIDGGDRPCDDPAQLREWAMRALRGDEVPE